MTRPSRLSVRPCGKAVTACLVSGALLATGAVALVIETSSGDSGGRAAPTGPRSSAVHSVRLPAPRPGTASVHTRDERTARFSLIGVTWDDAARLVEGRVRVRARNTGSGRWTDWTDLGSEQGEEGTTTPRRGGTEPVWVGDSDGIEVSIDGRAVDSLPTGLRLDLVDPDSETTSGTRTRADGPDASPHWELAAQDLDPTTPTQQAPTQTPTGTGQTPDTSVTGEVPEGTTPPAQDPTVTTPPPGTPTGDVTGQDPAAAPTRTATPTPTAPTSTPTRARTTTKATTVTQPAITPRSGWQADESLREQTDPDYTPAAPKVVFVHHTATTTDYACSTSPKIVRSLYSYHVSGLGWRDLGYNFVVDRCGTIFEGRHGGIDQGVIGAHTYGFNTGSTGISVIGTYTDYPAPLAARQAVAHLAAWKLGLAGQRSTWTAQLTEGASDSAGFTRGRAYTFKAISGHRDGYATECPGTAFYTKLSEIRAWAAVPTNVAVTGVGGAGSANGAYYTRGTVKLTWSNSTPTRLVRSFDVLVDGASSATTTGTATSASVTVPAGRHTVTVRATHLTGLTAGSAALTVNGDTTAPTFTTWPSAAPRTGQVSTTAVPVTIGWRASDNLALASVKATAPAAAAFGPTTTAWSTSLRPGGARKITLQPVDRAGNTGGAATITRTPLLTSEQRGTKVGTWSQLRGKSCLGGAIMASSRKGASMTWTVTGRSVALVALRSSRSGSATVYVDGARAGTVNLYSTSARYRQIVWTKAVSNGKHIVKIVVAGTSGHPNVHTDGLVVLQ